MHKLHYGLWLLLPSLVQAQLSGTWEQEWAINHSNGHNQKAESQLNLEWQHDFDNGDRLTAITRLKLDAATGLLHPERQPDNYSTFNGPLYGGSHSQFTLRELYWDHYWGDSYWRVGKQQVVWGQADGLKVLDVINPQSFQEFILDEFDDSRIPLWMVNAELTLGEGLLQALWIPDASGHQIPDTENIYAISSPSLTPLIPANTQVQLNPVSLDDHPLKDSDIGLRYSRFIQGWDLTLNYLYHYQDFAVQYQDLEGQQLTINPEYQRSHLLGATVSNAFGDITLRGEVGFESDSFQQRNDNQQRGILRSGELSSVLGLDYQGLRDTFISMQWFQRHLISDSSALIRDRTQHTLSLLVERDFANETLTLRLLQLHSLNNDDGLLRPKVSYTLSSNLDVWLGADIFYGTSDGLFGQFDPQDRWVFGFQLGF